ncbi:MAG: response regulator transcription factor [Chloroflexi bacterium]|nr:response regulator transcription factor [Chloroflexota bacterium]MCI0576726.1 response regulator transcription factor [Chloroflexota bacterium]MCI0647243.1 response regulator transcription factor [Chloroflexota bacterium]MCI0728897.1 response regulator transcription factor [Chloroflexota bacterium]
MSDLRLLVVAADPLSRAGLATLLADQPGYEVVGRVESTPDLPAGIDVYRPDVILWDLGWEAEENLALLAEIAEDGGLGIVALLPNEEQAAAAWLAGARGLLLRQVTAEKLLATATAVAQGLAVLEPGLAGRLAPAGQGEEMAPAEALTPREREVLQLLAEGLANKAIARRLEISEHTVKFHVNAIMSKLGAQSRTEAVVRATRLGLILL